MVLEVVLLAPLCLSHGENDGELYTALSANRIKTHLLPYDKLHRTSLLVILMFIKAIIIGQSSIRISMVESAKCAIPSVAKSSRFIAAWRCLSPNIFVTLMTRWPKKSDRRTAT